MIRSSNACITPGKIALLAGLLSILALTACSTSKSKAKKTLDDYVKPHNVRELQLDAFFEIPQFPEKAYASATITYNSADSSGKYTTEHRGFILKRAGEGFEVEKLTGYTTEETRARDFMAGLK